MVGQYEKPAGTVSSARRREGMALPASLAALTAVSVLISGIWVIVDLNAKTSQNRRSAVNALLIAEAGQSHAIALLRSDLRIKSLTKLLKGSDSVANNADDGLFIGHGLTSAKEIPGAGVSFGGGTYTATMEDDPSETDGDIKTDGNNRLLLRCKGTMPDGASAELIAIIAMVPLPAMATEGQLKISGNPRVMGACGGVHANEVVEVSGASVIVDGPVTASDTVKATSCQIKRLDNTCNPPLSNQPPIDIPVLTMDDVCINPTIRLKANGTITDGAGNPLPSNYGGWNFQGGDWKINNGQPPNGMYCSEVDVEISGGGTVGTPWLASIYSKQGVKVSGNPVMQAFDPFGGLIIAEGDVSVSGTPGAGYNYAGMIYAGLQCEMKGNAKINGQILCKDLPDPSGSGNYVNMSNTEQVGDLSGNPMITFNCNGSVLSKRRIAAWVQKLGS